MGEYQMQGRTASAQGTKVKGGAQRRINVTMDNALFLQVKDMATKLDRSINSTLLRLIKGGIAGEKSK